MSARRGGKKFYRITPIGLAAVKRIQQLIEESADMGGSEGFIVFARFVAGGLVYNRGDHLALDEGLRMSGAIQDSYLKRCRLPDGWRPRKRAAPAPTPAATFTPEPVAIKFVGKVPMPHTAALAAEMVKLMARGRDWSAAKDLTSFEVRARAQKEFADAPHFIDGVRTGTGTQRRIVDGFWPYIATLCQERSKSQAA